jgi:hypothetical protein
MPSKNNFGQGILARDKENFPDSTLKALKYRQIEAWLLEM